MIFFYPRDVIWPLEIVVTTQKPGTKKEKKTESSQSEKMNKKKKKKTKVNDDSITDQDVSEISISYDAVEPEDESDILFMNELGKPTTSETAVVYHGIAFVDLSRLVYPGEKSVRFACRVYPFSKELLMSKTCLTKSAFEDTLSVSIVGLHNFALSMLNNSSCYCFLVEWKFAKFERQVCLNPRK